MGAAVEAGAGHLQSWKNESLGRPTMVVWNHNDPVLKDFGGEALLANTLGALRRHDSTGVGPSFSEKIPLSSRNNVSYAEKVAWGAGASTPPTVLISWESVVPTHHWAKNDVVPGAFDASSLIWQFFLSAKVWASHEKDHGVDEIIAP